MEGHTVAKHLLIHKFLSSHELHIKCYQIFIRDFIAVWSQFVTMERWQRTSAKRKVYWKTILFIEQAIVKRKEEKGYICAPELCQRISSGQLNNIIIPQNFQL